MRYFVDADIEHQQVSMLAEDGRSLNLKVTDPDAADAAVAFCDPLVYGPPNVLMYDAKLTAPFVQALCDELKGIRDIKNWQTELGSPTLPAKPANPSGRWVQEAWTFLCLRAGVSTALETPPAPTEGTSKQ